MGASTSRSTALQLAAAFTHALLSVVAICYCLAFAGLAVMITDPCGSYLAADPRCDGTLLTWIWILLGCAALAGPVVGVVGLVRVSKRARGGYWLLLAGWSASVVLVFAAVQVGSA